MVKFKEMKVGNEYVTNLLVTEYRRTNSKKWINIL